MTIHAKFMDILRVHAIEAFVYTDGNGMFEGTGTNLIFDANITMHIFGQPKTIAVMSNIVINKYIRRFRDVRVIVFSYDQYDLIPAIRTDIVRYNRDRPDGLARAYDAAFAASIDDKTTSVDIERVFRSPHAVRASILSRIMQRIADRCDSLSECNRAEVYADDSVETIDMQMKCGCLHKDDSDRCAVRTGRLHKPRLLSHNVASTVDTEPFMNVNEGDLRVFEWARRVQKPGTKTIIVSSDGDVTVAGILRGTAAWQVKAHELPRHAGASRIGIPDNQGNMFYVLDWKRAREVLEAKFGLNGLLSLIFVGGLMGTDYSRKLDGISETTLMEYLLEPKQLTMVTHDAGIATVDLHTVKEMVDIMITQQQKRLQVQRKTSAQVNDHFLKKANDVPNDILLGQIVTAFFWLCYLTGAQTESNLTDYCDFQFPLSQKTIRVAKLKTTTASEILKVDADHLYKCTGDPATLFLARYLCENIIL